MFQISLSLEVKCLADPQHSVGMLENPTSLHRTWKSSSRGAIIWILEVGSRHQNEACGNRWTWNKMDAKFGFCIKFYARIQFFCLLGHTKLFLWLFKIPDFSRIIWTFHMKTNLGETFSPKFIFMWRSHIKISENGNFQRAVKIVWQVVLTKNFAFRHKFRCRIWIWHPFCFRFNGYHKPRPDVENRLRG